jgi:hypothetical protein
MCSVWSAVLNQLFESLPLCITNSFQLVIWYPTFICIIDDCYPILFIASQALIFFIFILITCVVFSPSPKHSKNPYLMIMGKRNNNRPTFVLTSVGWFFLLGELLVSIFLERASLRIDPIFKIILIFKRTDWATKFIFY